MLISKTNEPRTIRVSSHRRAVVYPFRPTKNISRKKLILAFCYALSIVKT
jgi:hypothetical protein